MRAPSRATAAASARTRAAAVAGEPRPLHRRGAVRRRRGRAARARARRDGPGDGCDSRRCRVRPLLELRAHADPRPRGGGEDREVLDQLASARGELLPSRCALQESVGVGDLPRVDDHDAVRSALARAGRAALERELPDGLLTRVGNRFTDGRELSGGQWQRLALAQGLMRSAPLLVVLDEPTASLDAPTESSLFERYAEAARSLAQAWGTITLLISHRFSTVRAADLIVVLDEGRVVEAGSHRDLIERGGMYAELFELQAQAYS